MIHFGNWVRVNIQLCDLLMDCGHEKRHHSFNGRVGILDFERCQLHDPPLCCQKCGKIATDSNDHIFGVYFEGDYADFKESELEDLGIDLMVGVPTMEKATV